ncbi:isoamylase early set domain-containing protein [bacterium]|nr:isoamylase early set domain-containing protein [bacterium]
MLERTYLTSRNVWKVRFSLPREECAFINQVTSVHLVGDFNYWDLMATPMKRKDNIYTVEIELLPGFDYHFRYLVNGRVWCNDCDADNYVLNRFGGEHCVLVLPHRRDD